jgi:hypothetical protein
MFLANYKIQPKNNNTIQNLQKLHDTMQKNKIREIEGRPGNGIRTHNKRMISPSLYQLATPVCDKKIFLRNVLNYYIFSQLRGTTKK